MSLTRAEMGLVFLVAGIGLVDCRARSTSDVGARPATTVASSRDESGAGSCFDSDIAADDPRYIAGYVSVIGPTAMTVRREDACEGDHYVREGRCPELPTEFDAQLGYYFLAYCAHGCRDGACLPGARDH